MRFVELFCGSGGMSRGFRDAGLEPVFAWNAWDSALAVYRDNIGGHVERLDLSDSHAVLTRVQRLRPNLIAGGPPCQEFSQAGTRQEGKRADLTIQFARVVADAQTEWFVMENVARARHSRAFEMARQLFKGSGYGLTELVLDASLCGVPQRRQRFFCIGRLGETDGFLDEALKVKQASKPLTVRSYLGDELDVQHYYRHPRSYARRAVYSIDEPAPTMRGTSRPVAPGYRRHPLDTVDPAATRALTIHERSRIQTFPKDWR